MVLCKHFMQGNCRFGSKCNFEHIDIKQLIKSDIESAINGKQYPFSCYGPFKDKPSIPNFIEDQSFEEVRLLCYEARQKNCFDQFYQQFSIGATDAMNKMKALLQPSYELMNIATMIYDAPLPTGNSSGSGASNLFGSNVAADGGASSIFGKSTITTAPAAGNNAFGGSSIFGGGVSANNNAMQQTASIFGGQNSFGTQQQSSIFGQQPQQQQQQQSNTSSIFGGVAKPTLFSQQQPPPTAGGGSNFGLFSQAAQQNANVFNQQTNFGQQQPQQQQMLQPQQSSGIFGQQSAFSMQPTQQSAFSMQPTQQSAFNMQPTQQNMGAFGSSQSQPQSQSQTQNLFGQTTQMQQPIGQQSISMGTNIFAQTMQQNSAGAPPAGFFQQAGTAVTNQNSQPQMSIQQQISVQQQQMPQQQQQLQQTMSQQPQDLTRNAIPQSTSQSNPTNSVYSKLEDLTAEEIEAFKADYFEPGKLPFSPPPVELLN